MTYLIKWRRGSRKPHLKVIRDDPRGLPPYQPGRGLGKHWALPPLSPTTVPVYLAHGAQAALVGIYEEYVDRYIESDDYECPPRHWLHARVPADKGILEYVFPLGASAEALLVRLVWLIQQCPGLKPVVYENEIRVNTVVGEIGIKENRVLTRFKPEGVLLTGQVWVSACLALGHIRVFTNGLNAAYAHLGEAGQQALTIVATQVRAKVLLRMLYDDGQVTGSALSGMGRITDRILSVEQALLRSDSPSDTLQSVLVPEHLSVREYRTLFGIPWKRESRSNITSDYLIRKLPLVRSFIESA